MIPKLPGAAISRQPQSLAAPGFHRLQVEWIKTVKTVYHGVVLGFSAHDFAIGIPFPEGSLRDGKVVGWLKRAKPLNRFSGLPIILLQTDL